MIHLMSKHARQRLITSLVLVASLLFQQVAMAALACTMPLVLADSASMSMSIPMSADMTPDCHAAMAAEHPAPASDQLCDKHCSPDPTSAGTPIIPPILPLALPPLLHALVLTPATRTCDVTSDEVFTRAHPPPHLRYCRLLI